VPFAGNEHMKLDWVRSSLICNGRIVRPALTPNRISDADLPDLCFRMHLILDTIEHRRCEGRLINLDIFEPIDTLASKIQHHGPVRLTEWASTMEQFGQYYELDGTKPIEVEQRSLDQLSRMAENFRVVIGGQSKFINQE
jgi:hypothetical protein